MFAPRLMRRRATGPGAGGGIDLVVVDALQFAPEFSGIGRRLMDLGRDLQDHPLVLPVEVRCSRDVVDRLRAAFPPHTRFVTPLKSSRPRAIRVVYQQLVAPLFDRPSTLLVCPGDQAPVWGRARILFVLHDVRRVTMPQSTGSRLEALYYRLVIRGGLRRAAAILTISEFSRREIVRIYGPAAPITVITSPVATASGPRDEDPGSPPAVLVVGALRPYKGLETLIEALARLASRGEDVPRVVCVGTDETGTGYDERLEKLAAERGVADAFELRGFVSDAELLGLRESCVAAVSPSEYEGFGLPLAESLAGGMPTIASSIPPHREIAGDAALYFEPGAADSLADALLRVTTDAPFRHELSAGALRQAALLGLDSPTWAEAIAAAAAGTPGERVSAAFRGDSAG